MARHQRIHEGGTRLTADEDVPSEHSSVMEGEDAMGTSTESQSVNRGEAREPNRKSPAGEASPWLTVKDGAPRARCGVKTIYREVQAGRLRAARIGCRRELRLLPEWVDAWLVQHSTMQEAR